MLADRQSLVARLGLPILCMESIQLLEIGGEASKTLRPLAEPGDENAEYAFFTTAKGSLANHD